METRFLTAKYANKDGDLTTEARRHGENILQELTKGTKLLTAKSTKNTEKRRGSAERDNGLRGNEGKTKNK
jgi:hypothetical protein